MVPIRGIVAEAPEQTSSGNGSAPSSPPKGSGGSRDQLSPIGLAVLGDESPQPPTPVRTTSLDELGRGFRMQSMQPMKPLFPKPGE